MTTDFSDNKVFIRRIPVSQLVLSMSEIAVVGKRSTIVIPKALRKELSLEEGQRVLMRVEDGKIIIEPLPRNPYEILEQVIGEPYEEGKDEAKAEEWLKTRAGH